MKMPETGIVLGKTYLDPITKIKGVAIAVTYWLHGCARVGLEFGVKSKDTTKIVAEIEWFDTDRVRLVQNGLDISDGAVKVKSKPVTGGPFRPSDARRADPSR